MTSTLTRYRALAFSVVAIVSAHLLDDWAWTHLRRSGVYDADFGRLFRVVGYLPLWLVLSAALWLQTRNIRRTLLLALVPTAAGLLGEVLKILMRRERPNLHEGSYVFRAYGDKFWSTRDIGLPSSHAIVAFGAAWLLCRFWPRAWPVWLLLAAGCGLTRVQAGAHFLSDVTVAAVAAYFLVGIIWKKYAPQ